MKAASPLGRRLNAPKFTPGAGPEVAVLLKTVDTIPVLGLMPNRVVAEVVPPLGLWRT